MTEAFHVKGPDGVTRTLDEHYDTQKDVEQDPYGAWLAIQNQATRIAELEASLFATVQREAETHRRHDAKLDAKDARIAELEVKLAKARDDALEEAAEAAWEWRFTGGCCLLKVIRRLKGEQNDA